jgi:hypothetical protein
MGNPRKVDGQSGKRSVAEKRSRGSRDKAKKGEKAEFTGVNEHF